MQASKPSSAIASSSVTDWCRLRGSSGPRRRTRPERIESPTERTASARPERAAAASRKAITSGKLCSVSMCSSVNVGRSGKNALSARCSTTAESLPPENSRATLRHSAATSRRMWMASASSASRWLRTAAAGGDSAKDRGAFMRVAWRIEGSCGPAGRRGRRAGRIPCARAAPTTSGRRAGLRRARRRACTARSRSTDSRGRAAR